MREKFKIDLDEMKLGRMAMILGLNPSTPQDWPIDTLNRLIAGEQENGFEWLIEEVNKMMGVNR
jgi:hypothetical protein